MFLVVSWVTAFLQDYRHLYYGGLSSTLLSPPAGEEVILEVQFYILEVIFFTYLRYSLR